MRGNEGLRVRLGGYRARDSNETALLDVLSSGFDVDESSERDHAVVYHVPAQCQACACLSRNVVTRNKLRTAVFRLHQVSARLSSLPIHDEEHWPCGAVQI